MWAACSTLPISPATTTNRTSRSRSMTAAGQAMSSLMTDARCAANRLQTCRGAAHPRSVLYEHTVGRGVFTVGMTEKVPSASPACPIPAIVNGFTRACRGTACLIIPLHAAQAAAQALRLVCSIAKTAGLPELQSFECRACRVSITDASGD
jgi:hypothetical protein